MKIIMRSLFYLKMGQKKVIEWPTNGQAWWELAVAQAINAQRFAAAQSLAQAFRLGFGRHGQYFLLARLLRMIGREKEGKFAFEKGVCGLFPSLTHIDPAQKPTEILLNPILEGGA